MFFSLAFAGLEVLGDPGFRAPDGIVDAAVAPDGAAWVISEHGDVVGFSTDGAIRARFDACPETLPHTRLWLAGDSAHLGVICEDSFRVLHLPDGAEVASVAVQTRGASLGADAFVLVGEPFEDGVTGDTVAVRYPLAGGEPTELATGELADVLVLGGATWVVERHTPEEGPSGWGLVRVENAGQPPAVLLAGDEPPRLVATSPTVACMIRGRSGRCLDVGSGAAVAYDTQPRPFLAPEQGIPVCNGTHCYAVDRTRLGPPDGAPGIGRIEALAASRDGAHLITRDHRDEVVHHGPRGRRPIASTDGAIAISPSGRFAWYQTARRSIRVRLVDGVRTTLPRATAAVFGPDDELWLALPHQSNTTLLSRVPASLEAVLPIVPLHDGREITGLQLAGDRMLLEYAQDDLFAVVDLVRRAPVDPNGKPTRKPFRDHVFTDRTPLLLTDDGGVLRTVEAEQGWALLGPDERPLEAAGPDPIVLGGRASGVRLSPARVDSFMGTRRRSAELPGPVHRIWVYDERVYIALRDGRLAILD